MGRRGPRPTPSKILKARGSWRATGREGEPEATGAPVCPTFLDDTAKEVWAETCDELDRMGILASADKWTLAAYCVACSQLARTTAELATDTLTTETQRGSASNPLVTIQHKAIEKIAKLASHFGLSPSARVGLRVDSNKSGSDDGANILKLG